MIKYPAIIQLIKERILRDIEKAEANRNAYVASGGDPAFLSGSIEGLKRAIQILEKTVDEVE